LPATDNELSQLRTRRPIEADRYRALIEHVADHAIYMLDPTGVVMTWNTGAARIKGYRAEEIIGHNFECFYTPEDRAREASGGAGDRSARREIRGGAPSCAQGRQPVLGTRRYRPAP
jgi:PAS domain S-box-containing protein